MRRILLAATLFATFGAEAAELRLRPSISVDAPEITLGDLFDGLDRKAAATFVATAPAPGEKLYLRPVGVAQVVQTAGFAWQPDASTRGIVVARYGRAIPREAVAERLNKALQREGAPDSFELNLSALPVLYTSREGRAAVRVDSMDFDPRSGRFAAVLSAEGGGEPVRVAGRVTATSAVPVLRAKVGPGDVISKQDIEWKDMPSDRVGRNYVTDIEDLVGQSPKRVLIPGLPVRVSDVQKPVAVAKNAVITMSVSSRGLSLTAMGRAIEAGATGDIIQVMNVQTKKTVQGVVTGPNLVQVLMPGATPLSN